MDIFTMPHPPSTITLLDGQGSLLTLTCQVPQPDYLCRCLFDAHLEPYGESLLYEELFGVQQRRQDPETMTITEGDLTRVVHRSTMMAALRTYLRGLDSPIRGPGSSDQETAPTRTCPASWA